METEKFLLRQRSANRKVVCIQGIGFVGTAMIAAVANARQADGSPLYGVAGKDVEEANGKIASILQGRSPISSSDATIDIALGEGISRGNLFATSDPAIYASTDILLVCLPVDFDHQKRSVQWEVLRQGIREANEGLPDGALLIVLSTVPPGTCEFEVRRLLRPAILLAHSYERVTPGSKYLDSVVASDRVFAGESEEASAMCKEFLKSIVTGEIMQVSSMRASETAKLLENSYRAVNIAFVQEWARYCEAIGINFAEIRKAVKQRKSHSNLLEPRLGVGGYCLTKDPLFAVAAPLERFGVAHSFPFCELAIQTNQDTPAEVVKWIASRVGALQGKRIHIMGCSYAPNVGDTRFSPSLVFADLLRELGATVDISDPFVIAAGCLEHPPNLNDSLYDLLFIAVAHDEYFDSAFWAERREELSKIDVFDGAGVLAAIGASFKYFTLGKGEDGLADIATA